jgi:hypothetical protein
MGQSDSESMPRDYQSPTTVGWQPTCKCLGNDASGRAVVLDPFGGAGTTSLVAKKMGLSSIYIDLNTEYAEMARTRLAPEQGSLLESATVEIAS